MTVDAKGTPFAGGGLSTGPHELGHIGQLVLNEEVCYGERLFPAQGVQSIRAGEHRQQESTKDPRALRSPCVNARFNQSIVKDKGHHLCVLIERFALLLNF